MKFGYFDDNAKEYVITTPDTPLPWINYLGSQDFFSLISNTCVTGKTEDEAIQNALRQLGLDRDDVSVEILERAKSGFLGLGSCPAKVRVSYGPEEEEEVLAPAPAPKEKPQEERPKPPKAEKPPRQERKPAEAPAPAPEEKTRQSAPVQTLGEEVDDEKAQAIRKFLSGLLEQMESAAEIHIYLLEKGRYKVILEGKNLGALIGRRGETLDAIQQLTSYAVNRSGSGRVRVQLDAENYRESGSRVFSIWPGRWPPRSPSTAAA